MFGAVRSALCSIKHNLGFAVSHDRQEVKMAAHRFLILLLLFLLKNVTPDSVPVLIIGSDSNHVPEQPSLPLKKLSAAEFESDFLDKIVGKGPVALFIQDTLSLEDFSVYGKAYSTNDKRIAFPNLQVLLDKQASLLLQAVKSPENAFGKLEENWNVVELKNFDTPLKSLSVEFTRNTLIFVKLPDTESSSDRSSALKKNDEIIGVITKQLREFSKSFVIIYTGRQSSWTLDQESHVRIARHILEAEEVSENSEIIWANNFSLLVSKNITYYAKNNDSKEDVAVQLTGPFTIASEKPDNTTIVLEVTANPNEESLKSITLKFEFISSRGNWLLNDINATITSEKIKGTFSVKTNDVWAPYSYSYACKQPGKFTNTNQSEHTFYLTFNNLQVQPFFKENSLVRFNYPFDCVGFFSIPILMAIFVAIIFILILAAGVQQMMSIHTMDRFDDPKGKTIFVPTTD